MSEHTSITSSVKGLTQDSRAVEDGFLYAAFPGAKVDGRDFIPQAIEKGASVILAPTGTELPQDLPQDITLIVDDNPRKSFARMVAEFYPDQPANIVAVTGTNGKTSIVHFTAQIWSALGMNATSIGTLAGGMTTADPVSLHQNLQSLAQDGITHVAMEASSHGLDQYRLDGVRLQAAGFTNLSRDHLDYHTDMDAYWTAKARLFTELLPDDGIAVINADSAEGQDIIKKLQVEKAEPHIWTYGENGDTFKIKTLSPTPKGQVMECSILGRDCNIELPLVGAFQAMNALCALGLVLAQAKAVGADIDTDKAIKALENIKGAPGRLQLIEGPQAKSAVFVDYAHTPDALENVLKALRPHIHKDTQGQLICLFGCGGDRDTGKRAQMGKVADVLADRVIVTDDNPRSENPDDIRAAITAAVSEEKLMEIAGRREAITYAIGHLREGDILVVAGKGHEQGQIFADHTEHFDDVEEVQIAILNTTKTQSVENIV